MSEFERNDPLGIVTEGLLQKSDPIAAAAGGVIRKKKYTWVAKVDAFVEASSLLEVTLNHNGDTDVTTVIGSDVEITYNPQTDPIPLVPEPSALYEFIPAVVVEEERGGRGAHTRRKQYVQPHIFIWDVPLKSSDAVKVNALCDVEFRKVERFSFIKSLPTLKVEPQVIEQKPLLHTYEYYGKVGVTVDAYSKTKHIDQAAILRRQEEDLLAMLLSDGADNLYVTTTYDYAGDVKRKEEEDLLKALGVL